MMDGRSPSKPNGSGVRKGPWTQEEDDLLKRCIERYGSEKWSRVPQLAGINRCRKSCRLRWLNYLDPGIKRGSFAEDEEDLVIRLHKLLGNRWSLIAGRLPGRTANDVKNYWNSNLRKKLTAGNKNDGTDRVVKLIKPQPTAIPVKWIWSGVQKAGGAERLPEESGTQQRTSAGEDHEARVDDMLTEEGLNRVESNVASGAERLPEESDTPVRASVGEDHEATVGSMITGEGLNHAKSNVANIMMEELLSDFMVEDLQGFRDEELILEGSQGWENSLSDINLWGLY